MQYSHPKCFKCKFLKSFPTGIGTSGSCTKYKSIPKKIFYEAGNCKHYTKGRD